MAGDVFPWWHPGPGRASILPLSYNNCQCRCHSEPGIYHIAPCCGPRLPEPEPEPIELPPMPVIKVATTKGQWTTVEDLRWRDTVAEPPPYRTQVLVRYKTSYTGPGEYRYAVLEWKRMWYAKYVPAWETTCGSATAVDFPEWRPLP